LPESRLKVRLELVMQAMMMLSSTPACASRTTSASGLVGTMLVGIVAGFTARAVRVGISGATGVAGADGMDAGRTTGGAEVCDGVLELFGEQALTNESTATMAPGRNNLEIESFINWPWLKVSFTVSQAWTGLVGHVFIWPENLWHSKVLSPAISLR